MYLKVSFLFANHLTKAGLLASCFGLLTCGKNKIELKSEPAISVSKTAANTKPANANSATPAGQKAPLKVTFKWSTPLALTQVPNSQVNLFLGENDWVLSDEVGLGNLGTFGGKSFANLPAKPQKWVAIPNAKVWGVAPGVWWSFDGKKLARTKWADNGLDNEYLEVDIMAENIAVSKQSEAYHFGNMSDQHALIIGKSGILRLTKKANKLASLLVPWPKNVAYEPNLIAGATTSGVLWLISAGQLKRMVLSDDKKGFEWIGVELLGDIFLPNSANTVRYEVTEDETSGTLFLTGAVKTSAGIQSLSKLQVGSVTGLQTAASYGEKAVNPLAAQFLVKYCAACHNKGSSKFITGSSPASYELDLVGLEKYKTEIVRRIQLAPGSQDAMPVYAPYPKDEEIAAVVRSLK